MNRQAKSRLATLIEELGEIAGLESRAATRHSNAGDSSYAEHAAWCVEGINEAIMLLTNRFPADAMSVLNRIVESSPGNLKPWRKTEPAQESLPELCLDGICNHLEHM